MDTHLFKLDCKVNDSTWSHGGGRAVYQHGIGFQKRAASPLSGREAPEGGSCLGSLEGARATTTEAGTGALLRWLLECIASGVGMSEHWAPRRYLMELTGLR